MLFRLAALVFLASAGGLGWYAAKQVNLASDLQAKVQTASLRANIAEIEVEREHDLNAPQGVRGRNSDNSLILEKLNWEPEVDLKTGLEKTYAWIEEQIEHEAKGELVIS